MIIPAAPSAYAADADQEKHWAELWAASPETGQVLWLEAGEQRYLALYREPAQRQPPEGAMVLVPGLGMHPNWPAVIAPLRQALSAEGWVTLSLYIPAPSLAPQEPKLGDEYYTQGTARINAALSFLQNKGLSPMVLLGYDLGAALAVHQLETHPESKVTGLIGIGLGSPGHLLPPQQLPLALAKLKIPLLDLYGSRDHDSVIAGGQARALVMTGNKRISSSPLYRQIVIAGADHDFSAHESTLSKRIRGWLKQIKKDARL